MNAMRTIASALTLVAGVVLLAAWALANVVVNLVEDGTAARAMTEQALDSPALMAAVTHDLSGRTTRALVDMGFDVTALGLEDQVHQLVSHAVNSQTFRTALVDQVDQVHHQFSDQLTDPTRPPAPLAISVNLSDSINDGLADMGGPAVLIPDLTVPPVEIHVVEAERFEQAREAYTTVQTVQTWALWLGLSALIVGFLVSHRKRWFPAKALFGLAAVFLSVGAAVALFGPRVLSRFLPGGRSGPWANVWGDVVGEEAAIAAAERALLVGGVALVAALVAVAIAVSLDGRRRF